MFSDLFQYNINARSIAGLRANERVRRNLWQWGFIGLAVLIGLYMAQGTHISYQKQGIKIDYAIVIWILFLTAVIVILRQPRIGVYLTLPLAVAGDPVLTWWYPFDVNFSSEESLLYLHDSLIISPLEAFLILMLFSWLGRLLLFHRARFYKHIFAGDLLLPALIFTFFISYGLFYGVAGGGDSKIALWESRSIFYLPLTLILTSNLITERSHAKILVWGVIFGVFVEGVFGTRFFFTTMNGSLAGFSDIMDHPAAIHMNAVFVYAAAVWLYRVSYTKRFLLLSMLPFIGITYLAAQRRSAFVSLGIALGLLMFGLLRINRKLFFVLAPTFALVGVLYIGAFWNYQGALGLPAQAVKSIVSPASESDRNSNQYRLIENMNTHFTIKNNPLTGVGFGNKFWILVPMDDISFFEWWEYITHNSVLWIWVKTGIGGFMAMLFLVGRSIMLGGQTVWRMPGDEMGAIAAFASLYIIMHMTYAYVDISWTHQNMLFLGTMMGLVNCLETVVAKPVPKPKPRWRWLAEPINQ